MTTRTSETGCFAASAAIRWPRVATTELTRLRDRAPDTGRRIDEDLAVSNWSGCSNRHRRARLHQRCPRRRRRRSARLLVRETRPADWSAPVGVRATYFALVGLV